MGRRPGRLPGRQLPGALGGVERHRTATRCATSGAGDGDRRATSPRASPARATSTSRDGRDPFASINFVTAHDGFTLRDLVSYNEKHNEANGEDNRDGTDDNRSWNCGVEGPTDDPAINALRARQQRNFLATLLLSQGVPMLLGGDEIGRTQHGNNNAWCQDNEHLVVRLGARRRTSCSDFAQRLIALRARASRVPPLDVPRRARDARVGAARRLVVPAGRAAHDAARLAAPDARVLGVFLNGARDPVADGARRGGASTTRSCSSSTRSSSRSTFTLPTRRFGASWELELATGEVKSGDGFPARAAVTVPDLSLTLLRRK